MNCFHTGRQSSHGTNRLTSPRTVYYVGTAGPCVYWPAEYGSVFHPNPPPTHKFCGEIITLQNNARTRHPRPVSFAFCFANIEENTEFVGLTYLLLRPYNWLLLATLRRWCLASDRPRLIYAYYSIMWANLDQTVSRDHDVPQNAKRSVLWTGIPLKRRNRRRFRRCVPFSIRGFFGLF